MAATALAAGLFVTEYGESEYSVARLTLIVAVGLAMVGSGLLASVNGEDRVGVMVVLAGGGWLLERLLQATPTDVTATAGYVLTGLWAAVLAHAVLSFPAGRLASSFERALVVGGYVINGALTVLYLLFAPAGPGLTPRNLLVLHTDALLAERISDATAVLTVIWAVAMVAAIARKALVASPPVRRAYGFVWIAGGVLYANGAILVSAGLGLVAEDDAYGLWLEIIAGVVPAVLAASLLATRVAEDRLVHLVVDLGAGDRREPLHASLRRALADPSLDLVYWRPEGGGWIDSDGQPASVPIDGSTHGRTLTPVDNGGAPIAALVHDPVLLRNPERLATVASAAALAIDNERLRAELRARLAEVQASRARLVEAGDRERRRVERNLHDGAQQRLMSVAMALRVAEGRARAGHPAVTDLVTEAATELDCALKELRALARGLHPAIVTDAGLAGALETLAERPGVPVELSIDLPDPLPEPVAVGAYYVVAEALTNVNRHACALSAEVRATVDDGALRLVVSDDGAGGAVPRSGSGLEGLADRVDALGGRLQIDSALGRGTEITVHIPCA